MLLFFHNQRYGLIIALRKLELVFQVSTVSHGPLVFILCSKKIKKVGEQVRHGIDYSFAKYKLGACPVGFLLRRQLPTQIPTRSNIDCICN